MTPDQLRALFAVAETRFYQPRDDAPACAELVEMGYIQPIAQGKLTGYCLALPGTIVVRRRMGYE